MNHRIYTHLFHLLSDYKKCNLVTITEKNEQKAETVKKKYILEEGEAGFSYLPQSRIMGEQKMYIEPVAKKERLIILGGGHISRELCSFAAKTGFSERDCTPEATMAVATRNAPGIAEAIRAGSMQITKRAMLSREASVIRNKTLIVNLPGSPKAVKESLSFVLDQLDHGIRILTGRDLECARK